MNRVWAADVSKLNNFELIKLQKDGLDVLKDIDKLSHLGYHSISKTDLDLLKWAGLYSHKSADGHFMMRVKLPAGNMNSEQALTLAGISRDYGRSLVDITTRQAVQFHWLSNKDLPEINQRLSSVNLSAVEACGDCPRTVVGNPLHDIDPDELFDTQPLVNEVYQYFQDNRLFSNLPRKFKISISSSRCNANHAHINDLAFTPAVKEINSKKVYGFNVMVGGGLSVKPHMAQKLDIFVRPEEVLKTSIAAVTIFRDYGYRQNRRHCRLKYLAADWGAEKFCAELKKLTGPLLSSGEDLTEDWNAGHFYGIKKQKQPGFYYVGLSVPMGRMTAADLEELAALAVKYGDGSIRTCNSQNIILTNIPQKNIKPLLEEKLLDKLTPFPQPFSGYAISCPGNEFCKKALVETKDYLQSVVDYLDKHVEIDTPIRINASGCPNSCGQHQIADIGLQGSLQTVNGQKVEAFEISVGGWLGNNAGFAEKLKGRVNKEQTAEVIESLINFYLANRKEGEPFNQFVRRIGVQAFQEQLDKLLNS